jgi:hypothetical protein
MGYDVWDRTAMTASAGKLAFAERYYRDFYRMLRESASDGVVFWWYAGGYRLNERSDYGILNPDGTDRSVTRVIREEGAVFLAAPIANGPEVWLEVDRDADARGLPGMYDAVKEGYWRVVGEGRRPGLRWREGVDGRP